MNKTDDKAALKRELEIAKFNGGQSEILAARAKDWLWRDIDRIIEALSQQPIPEGYVLAPIESTTVMDNEGVMALSGCGIEYPDQEDARLCYKAMIKAAPNPREGDK